MNAGKQILKCMSCGFDLRVHQSADRCPECGIPVAESEVHHADRPRVLWQRRLLIASLIWALTLAIGNCLFAFQDGMVSFCILLWIASLIAFGFLFFLIIGDKKEHDIAIVLLVLLMMFSIVAIAVNVVFLFVFPLMGM